MAEIIGREARALGASQLFAPEVDLACELRYGRVSFQSFSHNIWSDGQKGRRNFLRGSLPGRRDRLQLCDRSAEQKCFSYGETLCWIQQPRAGSKHGSRAWW